MKKIVYLTFLLTFLVSFGWTLDECETLCSNKPQCERNIEEEYWKLISFECTRLAKGLPCCSILTDKVNGNHHPEEIFNCTHTISEVLKQYEASLGICSNKPQCERNIEECEKLISFECTRLAKVLDFCNFCHGNKTEKIECDSGGYLDEKCSNGLLCCSILTDEMKEKYNKQKSICLEAISNLCYQSSQRNDYLHLRTIFEDIVESFPLLTSVPTNIPKSNATNILNIFEKAYGWARKKEITIDPDTNLRDIVSTFSHLVESNEVYAAEEDNSDNHLQQTDKIYSIDNSRSLGNRLTKLLPEFCSLPFALNQTIWKMNTESFLIEAKDHSNSTDSTNVILSIATVPVSAIVPNSLIKNVRNHSASENNSDPVVRSVFIYYRKNPFREENATYIQKNVTNVVSITIGDNQSLNSNLEEPVIIRHENLSKENFADITCVFWSFNTSKWSNDNCRLINVSAETLDCECNHLTNFALLLGFVENENDPARKALKNFTIVGCSLSIFGLAVTIIFFAYRRDLRKYRPGKILLHLCSNLCITYIIVVFGVEGAVGNNVGCVIVAFLLQYFFLVSWGWMGVYSYQIYIALVKVFQTYQSKFMLKASIICYFIPAIITSLTFGIIVGTANKNNSNTLNFSAYHFDYACWPENKAFYCGFCIPISVILIGNIIVFIMVIYELAKKIGSNTNKHERITAKQSIMTALTMMSVMGLSWIFGFLSLLSEDNVFETVMSWLFAVAVTLQGFTIFLFTIVRRKETRESVRNFLRKCKRPSTEPISSSTPSKSKTYDSIVT